MVEIKIPISVGELIDKITILQIKSQHTENEYVIKELKDLREISKQIDYDKNLEEELYVINRKLWDVEDAYCSLLNLREMYIFLMIKEQKLKEKSMKKLVHYIRRLSVTK
jgi:hypothetical protein